MSKDMTEKEIDDFYNEYESAKAEALFWSRMIDRAPISAKFLFVAPVLMLAVIGAYYNVLLGAVLAIICVFMAYAFGGNMEAIASRVIEERDKQMYCDEDEVK